MLKRILLLPFNLSIYISKRLLKSFSVMTIDAFCKYGYSLPQRLVEWFLGAFEFHLIGSGLIAGAIVGGTYGAMLGTLIFPGIGTIAGGILGGIVGAIIVGGVATYVGKQISRLAKFGAVKLGIYGPEDDIVSKTNPMKYKNHGYIPRNTDTDTDTEEKYIALCKDMRTAKNQLSSREDKDYFSQMIKEVIKFPIEYTTSKTTETIGNIKFKFFPPPTQVETATDDILPKTYEWQHKYK